MADPEARIVRLFDVKLPVLRMASRVTYVVGERRTVLSVQLGSEAIDPSGAIRACSLKRPGPDARH